MIFFLHTLPFALIQLKQWLSAAFFPPWSSVSTLSLSCEHEGWRAEADVSPLAAGMSLFFQGTACECSAALSTLPQGSFFWQYFWTVLFLSGVRTRVGIVTPVLQMLRDLNSVHFLCFNKKVIACEEERGIQWAQPSVLFTYFINEWIVTTTPWRAWRPLIALNLDRKWKKQLSWFKN